MLGRSQNSRTDEPIELKLFTVMGTGTGVPAYKSHLGLTLHMGTCRVISRTAGPIVFKFGTPIGTGWQDVVQVSW